MAGSFPAGELRYMLEQSQAALFLSSSKMQGKADEVLHDGFEARPRVGKVEKIDKGSPHDDRSVTLEDTKAEEDRGGLMLYTSGTTSRPVQKPFNVPAGHSIFY